MPNRNLVTLVVALVMALGATLLVHNWLTTRTKAPTGRVVVAARALPFGAELTADNLTEVAWPADSVPQGAFRSERALLKGGGRFVLSPIAQNEPILTAKITMPGQPASLSNLLKGDMRAVTVGVDVVRGVGGFVLPGDRVDVVLIRRHTQDQKSYADVVVQDVKVLAVDQKANERPGGKAAIVARAVTLAASAENAQKILLASNIGKLALTLRQAGRKGREALRRISERDLISPDDPPPQPEPKTSAVAPKPVVRTVTVVVLRGTRAQEYTVPVESPVTDGPCQLPQSQGVVSSSEFQIRGPKGDRPWPAATPS